MTGRLITADCLVAMAAMDAASVDAIVCDPPYNLTANFNWTKLGENLHPSGLRPKGRTSTSRREAGFMGKTWDGTGIAFDPATWEAALRVAKPGAYLLAFGGTRTYHRLACAIEDAGWIIRDCLVWAYASGFPKSKASLKPAWEPIVMARKPGPLRELAIDACRIPTDGDDDGRWGDGSRPGGFGDIGAERGSSEPNGHKSPLGRWPANIVLTDPIFDGDVDGVVGGGAALSAVGRVGSDATPESIFGGPRPQGQLYADTGTYSRFFLIPKAARRERERGLTPPDDGKRANTHPTVKPVQLMRHLVRLITPADGIVLDPFLGSGTTAIAAESEGFGWIGIEREAEYVAIAKQRILGSRAVNA